MGPQLLGPATVNLGSASASTEIGHAISCSKIVPIEAKISNPRWICESATVRNIDNEIYSIVYNKSE
jgi:hypothetical protein